MTAMGKAEAAVRNLLALAGIDINGDQPWDLRVNDRRFYQRLLSGGPLGFGESYMAGLWDCEALDQLIYKALRADLEHKISPLKLLWPVIWSKMVNLQSRKRAFRIGEHHYDPCGQNADNSNHHHQFHKGKTSGASCSTLAIS